MDHPKSNGSSERCKVFQFRPRVKYLEDLRELNEAIGRNGAKPLIPWPKARKELGL